MKAIFLCSPMLEFTALLHNSSVKNINRCRQDGCICFYL